MGKIFKAIGNIAKGIGKGLVKDILPIPSIKDATKEVNLKKVAGILRSNDNNLIHSEAKKSNKSIELYIADLLDDGKLNESYDEAKIQGIARAITGVSTFIAVIIYTISQLI